MATNVQVSMPVEELGVGTLRHLSVSCHLTGHDFASFRTKLSLGVPHFLSSGGLLVNY